jgi:hypothetical protein
MTPLVLTRVEYSALNARQKENYNYQKIAGVLADYGFVTHRLSDDWNGADFIAQHLDGIQFLKVQLKPRLCFQKKYLQQDIYIAFPVTGGWYLYPPPTRFSTSCRSRRTSKRPIHGLRVGLTLFPSCQLLSKRLWLHTSYRYDANA